MSQVEKPNLFRWSMHIYPHDRFLEDGANPYVSSSFQDEESIENFRDWATNLYYNALRDSGVIYAETKREYWLTGSEYLKGDGATKFHFHCPMEYRYDVYEAWPFAEMRHPNGRHVSSRDLPSSKDLWEDKLKVWDDDNHTLYTEVYSLDGADAIGLGSLPGSDHRYRLFEDGLATQVGFRDNPDTYINLMESEENWNMTPRDKEIVRSHLG